MSIQTDCTTCTPPEGSTSILTVHVPGGLALNVDLLGVHLEVCPLCITLFVDGDNPSAEQLSAANELRQQIIQVIQALIPNIPSA